MIALLILLGALVALCCWLALTALRLRDDVQHERDSAEAHIADLERIIIGAGVGALLECQDPAKTPDNAGVPGAQFAACSQWAKGFDIVDQARWIAAREQPTTRTMTVDGMLRRVGDVWVTHDARHGTITHTLKAAEGDERRPADCRVCAGGECLVEVQTCDAWDARVVVHDPGADDRS